MPGSTLDALDEQRLRDIVKPYGNARASTFAKTLKVAAIRAMAFETFEDRPNPATITGGQDIHHIQPYDFSYSWDLNRRTHYLKFRSAQERLSNQNKRSSLDG